MLWIRCLLCLLMLSVPGASLLAASVVLGPGSSGQGLNGQVDLLEDPSGKLGIADLQRADVQAGFRPADGRESAGRSPSAWWLRVTLQKGTDAPARWWLELGGMLVLDARLYLPDGQDGWIERVSGERVPFAEGRDYPYRRGLFELPELGDQPLTIYVRSYDPAGNLFPLRIWQLGDLQLMSGEENFTYGLIYGVVLALLLYNLFILFSLRDRAYFWYVLTTGCSLLMMLAMSGHAQQYLWPNIATPVWLDRMTMPSLWSVLLMRFTIALLSRPGGSPWPTRVLNVVCGLYGVAILINALGMRHEASLLIALLPVLTMPIALGWAALRSWQGFVPARFYLIGYGFVLVSAVILLLRAGGVIPPLPLIGYFFPLAVSLEAILFSFALAYRIQMLRQEKAVALRLADREKSARLEQIQRSAEELQGAVELRTAELADANRQLQHAAFHDSLTELPNRRYLLERLDAAMADSLRRGESLALLLLDLDHFKPINDQHGHDAGDFVLRALGQRLQAHLRRGDFAARLGGDEFAVLVTGPGVKSELPQIVERLLQALNQPVEYGGVSLLVGVSIGTARFPDDADQLTELYKAADSALYQAKQLGRGTYVIMQ
ncbi:diguanylate cyclase [Pseudomonas sp. PDM16]|uniref:diguanylate cyclase n=1 Tax=Pseudomonas sp. PDM16 TaxID=2769292 RepID=UPI001785EB78|nr:diguanylate cyclase [Pseudomonas sp. PDM16]MBD9414164.1 diguanylate cyclase [Pseudomonas sp. PDM16]